MANLDEAIKTLKLIARHSELLVSSHLNQSGEIPYTEENESLIRSLKASRLVWQLDETESVQVSSVLTRLIDHSLINYRRHVAHEAIADLWSHIAHLINDQYYPAKTKCATRDLERVTAEIQELCIELIEMIHSSTIRFSEYISSKFAFISDIELRIKKNEQVILQAQRLNDLLNTFTFDELTVTCGADVFLRRLFLKTFSKEVEKSRRNLLNSLHQLNDLLHSLRESAEINRLLELFERKYDNDRGFLPNIESLSRYPVFLRSSGRCIEDSFVNTSNILDEDILADLCQNTRDIPKAEEQSPPVTVEDVTEQDDEIVEQDIVNTMAEALILAAQSSSEFISALDVYDRLENQAYDTWLYALINTIEALPSDDRDSIQVAFVEKVDANFPNNYEILDIKVKENATSTI